MRILMVSEHYFPHVGGISVHIHNLAAGLRRRGHSVDVLTTRHSTRVLEPVSCPVEGGSVYHIGRAVTVRANSSWAAVAVGLDLDREIEDVLDAGFDIVHIHGSVAPTLPLLAIRHARDRVLITLHSYGSNSRGYRFFRPLLKPYMERLDGVIGVSQAAIDAVARCFTFDYRIIPNGIDPEQFCPLRTKAPGFPVSGPRLLFVGRFEPKKGLEYLLQALPVVKRRFPDFRLVIVGTGPLRHSYDRYITPELRGNVSFAGVVNPVDMPGYYLACDLFCAPSIGNESFGIVLLEAMATGKPVVASDIPGYREVVTPGEDGILVPPRSPEALAQAIIRALEDDDLRLKLRSNGLRKVRDYTWDSVAGQVENYYEELVARDLPILDALGSPRMPRWCRRSGVLRS
jgi:phosphatidylinositol alpha-mannosyltransferase